MEENSTPPSRAVRLLAFTTSAAILMMAAATAIAAPLAIYTATGNGDVTVSAILDEPFVLELFDGRRLSVNPDGISLFESFPIGNENATATDVPPPRMAVQVGQDDIDSRIAASAGTLALLAAGWFGLVNLWDVLRAARDGTPFTDRSARRLRRVALAIAMVLVIDAIRAWLLSSTIDSTIAVRVGLSNSPWLLITAATGFLALSWIFAEANRLRRFEEATI